MRVSAVAISIALLFLVGCEPERPQPSAAEFQEERSKLNERVAERKAKKNSGASKPTEVASNSGHDGNLNIGGANTGFVYVRAGKRDPFRSYEWERLETVDNSRGPLEQFDVSQLSVVAVIWNTGNAKAMIQDPSGQGYIVGMGARVGKNDGLITSINDNLVIVKETYEDYLGQVTKKDIEMRIHRIEGGGLNVGIY